jgi:phage baseplate assembly protein W
MPAAEAALMRWNPQLSLGAIRALREQRPGWPVVSAQVQQVAA